MNSKEIWTAEDERAYQAELDRIEDANRMAYTQLTSQGHELRDAATDSFLRMATLEEIEASDEAAAVDGGAGLFALD